MKQIICDGCKKGEKLSSGDMQGKTIIEVKLVIDERESIGHNADRHVADLCPECRTNMLNSYFAQKVDTTEAIMPESLKAEEA